ncbi:hypothetical protein SAMN06309945_0192 [Okibacterium fritillariae]|uniref:Uncharacterized protein n=1 Tax=Okibacterium fritillariae TaxID=123320 RepID=A0A1T5IBA7_9MICO|nr:hypothetical protein SAMN06309945_0192 [Okibacterium fritillariae]
MECSQIAAVAADIGDPKAGTSMKQMTVDVTPKATKDWNLDHNLCIAFAWPNKVER